MHIKDCTEKVTMPDIDHLDMDDFGNLFDYLGATVSTPLKNSTDWSSESYKAF